MNHQWKREKLLNAVIEKSEIYFSIGDSDTARAEPFSGAYAEMLRKAREEWKAAEKAYNTFLQATGIQSAITEDHFSARLQLS